MMRLPAFLLALLLSASLAFGQAVRVSDRLPLLRDVTITNPANGEVLKYNSTSSKWENGTASAGSVAVGDITGFGSGVATFLATPSAANFAAAVTGETGTGAPVLATSPTLVTPNLGTPSAVTLTNGTGLPISTGVSGLGSGVATFLATPTSANLAGAVTDETGTSGGIVLATGAAIDPASVGATTRGTGAFTTLAANGAVTFTASTASTSTTTGALVVTGGAGIGGFVYAGAYGFGSTSNSSHSIFLSGGQTYIRGGGADVGVNGAGLTLSSIANRLHFGGTTASQAELSGSGTVISIRLANAGNGGALRITDSGSTPTTPTSGALFYSASGEMRVIDSSGNNTVISPHPKDAPADLYESGPGLDNIDRTANIFTGTVRWWNHTRRQRIDQLDMASRGLGPTGTEAESSGAWNEVFARRQENRLRCLIVESFAQYETRTGVSLWPAPEWASMTPAQRWDALQAAEVARSAAARAEWFAIRSVNPDLATPEPPLYTAQPAPDFK